jgi:hypothetical protein
VHGEEPSRRRSTLRALEGPRRPGPPRNRCTPPERFRREHVYGGGIGNGLPDSQEKRRFKGEHRTVCLSHVQEPQGAAAYARRFRRRFMPPPHEGGSRPASDPAHRIDKRPPHSPQPPSCSFLLQDFTSPDLISRHCIRNMHRTPLVRPGQRTTVQGEAPPACPLPNKPASSTYGRPPSSFRP